MAILEDLATSISEMTDEELAESFREIRLARRTFKSTKKVGKSKKKAKTKTLTPPPVSAISPSMAAELLKQLEGN